MCSKHSTHQASDSLLEQTASPDAYLRLKEDWQVRHAALSGQVQLRQREEWLVGCGWGRVVTAEVQQVQSDISASPEGRFLMPPVYLWF